MSPLCARCGRLVRGLASPAGIFDPKIAPEDFFLAELDMIDLHHGPHSTNTPYTEFEVVGCPLTTLIREALTQLGFTDFDYRQSGFIAKRTVEEAAMQRP